MLTENKVLSLQPLLVGYCGGWRLSASALDINLLWQKFRGTDLTPSIVRLLRRRALSLPEKHHNLGI